MCQKVAAAGFMDVRPAQKAILSLSQSGAATAALSVSTRTSRRLLRRSDRQPESASVSERRLSSHASARLEDASSHLYRRAQERAWKPASHGRTAKQVRLSTPH